MHLRRVGLYGSAALLFILPVCALADGLVPPCNNLASNGPNSICNLCDFYTLIQNIINYLIGLSIPIAVFLFAYAGFLYFTSAANPGNISQARKIFSSALIGFLIAISAWLLVQTIINVLVSPTYLSGWSWNKVNGGCANTNRPGIVNAQGQAQNITVTDWLGGVLGNVAPPTQVSSAPTPGGSDSGLNTVQCISLMQQSLSDLTNGQSNTESEICNEAKTWASLPQSTVDGPSGGDEACAWSVNNILQQAISLQDNTLTTTAQLESELKAIHASTVPASQAHCGDIVFSAPESGGPEHVGICANTGCTQIISNSSSYSEFGWCSNQNFCMTHTCLGLGNIYKIP